MVSQQPSSSTSSGSSKMADGEIRAAGDPKRVLNARVHLSPSVRRVKVGTPLHYASGVGWVPTPALDQIAVFCLESKYGDEDCDTCLNGIFDFAKQPGSGGTPAWGAPLDKLFEPGARYRPVDIDDYGNMTFLKDHQGFLALTETILILSGIPYETAQEEASDG